MNINSTAQAVPSDSRVPESVHHLSRMPAGINHPRPIFTASCRWGALTAMLGMVFVLSSCSSLPRGYTGKPFEDSVYKGGPQVIPGRLQCAYFDFGGEGVAFHSDGTNHGNGELNLRPDHRRWHATPYIWEFRTNEAVSVSYCKDMADLNHTNLFRPDTNQFYIGWTKDGQWLNYTIKVKTAGTYKVTALYSDLPNVITFSINNGPPTECKFPLPTGNAHKWNKAEIGTITFPKAGVQLLTMHYKKGNNLAYFDFDLIEKK